MHNKTAHLLINIKIIIFRAMGIKINQILGFSGQMRDLLMRFFFFFLFPESLFFFFLGEKAVHTMLREVINMRGRDIKTKVIICRV